MKLEQRTKEIEILRIFLLEFSPIYSEDMVNGMGYSQLIKAVKETAKEL